MELIKTIREVKQFIDFQRKNNKKTGFVPTMGALHKGHLSLIKKASIENDFVVVSIFVNPVQFNDPEDYKRYPRNLDEDMKKLTNSHVDLVFAPSVEEMYPEPDTRKFDFGVAEKVMEGKFRPGHFNGVAIVVSRLFDIIKPERAYFGEKDFQQLVIIRLMTRMLDFPVEIVPCPIIREKDGLAMSSRNVLLTPVQRDIAPAISKILSHAKMLSGSYTPQEVKNWVTEQIEKIPEMELDYFEIADINDLHSIDDWKKGAIGCIAVFLGKIRLIDNIIFR